MTLFAEKITIERGDKELIQSLSFNVGVGEALQITGDNGAGKTSLLRAICGLQPVTSGQFSWKNQPLDECFSQSMLYIGHQNAIKPALTVRENIQLDTAMYKYHTKKHSLDTVLVSLNLADMADTPARFLSIGQQRRLGLARLLRLEAFFWILDEPFAGLDHKSCIFLEEQFAEHLQARKSIIFTSHQNLLLQKISVKQLEL